MLSGGIGIHYKIALFQELIVVLLLDSIDDFRCMQFATQRAFYLDILDNQAVGIKQFTEITIFCGRILASKEPVVKPSLSIKRTLALHPVDGRFRLAVSTFCARLGVGVIGRIDGRDTTFRIFVASRCLNDITALETYLTSTRTEALEFIISLLEEVTSFDP